MFYDLRSVESSIQRDERSSYGQVTHYGRKANRLNILSQKIQPRSFARAVRPEVMV